ncbi:MAG: hypothetical protein IPO22_15750 [Anaerolineales bacterium]|nr:hypothetical protein [Anaerolineales bacterium]
MALDLTLAPLYRINGQEIASLPGLIALTPPPNAARIRNQDRLLVYLLLTGNAVFSSSEYMQVAQDAVNAFYQTTGSTTNALRTAAELVNKTLLDRNMSTSGRGQYANGWLTLAALRDLQCTLSISGPMHMYWFGKDETRHIHEPATSGKGLGISQNTSIYYGQIVLSAGDRLLLAGRIPSSWESTLNDSRPSSVDAMRRRLSTLTREDLNSVLLQVTDGTGKINLISTAVEVKEEIKEEVKEEVPPPPPLISNLPHREEVESTPEQFDVAPEEPAAAPEPSAHYVQPSAYSIPPEQETPLPGEKPPADPLASLPRSTTSRAFPSSIPRAQPKPQTSTPEIGKPIEAPVLEVEKKEELPKEELPVEEKVAAPQQVTEPEAPREPSERTRQMAKMLANGIQATRRLSGTLGEKFRNFLPRLLPNAETTSTPMPSSTLMFFMAVLVPLMVVVVLVVVYLRYGVSQQYDAYLAQALENKAQAQALTNPVEQRIAWNNVLDNVKIAESHRETNETVTLRKEANDNLDKLLGITRLQFNAAFSSKPGINISRMAANETDLFMLNAETGEALRAVPAPGGRGFQIDSNFNCRPGVYGSYTVGQLVDILALPGLNSFNATLLGIDSNGYLLYCAPGTVPQIVPLPKPATNWGHITAFTMSNGNLYVLDAPARAVWVYNGKDGTFTDQPYFFFGKQTPTQDVIDFIISGDDLYMLHGDGHLSVCTFTTVETSTSQCKDPLPLVNLFSAYQDMNLFSTAHFTQLLFAAPPDQSILLLDTDSQGVMRFAPRSLELQNQFRPAADSSNPISSGPASAVTVSPNHVLYLAVDGQVYFAANMP